MATGGGQLFYRDWGMSTVVAVLLTIAGVGTPVLGVWLVWEQVQKVRAEAVLAKAQTARAIAETEKIREERDKIGAEREMLELETLELRQKLGQQKAAPTRPPGRKDTPEEEEETGDAR